ncbi:MAG: hypothetical protein JSR99_11220 [Proteobacteria bacterium]|nr:hypothetical protein [Pseudomonadota bacterium]
MLRAGVIRLYGDHPVTGFAVAYEQDELQFPVWVLIVLATVLLCVSLSERSLALMLLSLLLGGFAFHNIPLIETGTARLAANHEGLFMDGLGCIGWRFVSAINLVEVVVRGNLYKEADIALSEPLEKALVDDARSLPLHRRLMRKPYYLKTASTIRVPLDIFDPPPDDIVASLLRIWIHNRGRPPKASG